MFNLTMLKTMDTTKRQRLLIMYDYARANKFCKNKKTFAQLIEMSDCNMSNAMNNDNSNYLTDNLFYKINAALGNVFSVDWLLRGTGEMMVNNDVRFSISSNNNVQAHTPAPAHTKEQEHKPLKPSYDEDDVEFLKHRIKELEYIVELQRYRIKELEKGRASAHAN